MNRLIQLPVKIVLLVVILFLWTWALDQHLPAILNLSFIIGCELLIFPVAWTGRVILDKNPTLERATWITVFVHFAVAALAGLAIIRAISTYRDWTGWILPIPARIGWYLVVVSGTVLSMTVINLALSGFGAPFAIFLSKKLASDWMYAWTRNPMVLALLICLTSVGIWFRSLFFVLWSVFIFAPALLFFVKVYEERELEIRFGQSYLDYKAKTPMLFPRKPKG